MPRTNSIKWRKQDAQKIASLARRFNAKLTRLNKAHPELAPYLPQRLSTVDLKARSLTRRDFNRIVNSYERFLKPGAETPVITKSGILSTKWEVREARIKLSTINRMRSAERKKAIETGASIYKGTQASITERGLNELTLDLETITGEQWPAVLLNLEKQVSSDYYANRVQKYRHNYMTAFERELPDGELKEELRVLVEQIPDSLLYDIYYADPIMQLQYMYTLEEANQKMQAMISHAEVLLSAL